jgi:hypothetical protein
MKRWGFVIVAAALAAIPAVAAADPVTIVATAMIVLGEGMVVYAGYALLVAAAVYGAANARRQARRAAAQARAEYNARLTERSVTVLAADPPWQVVYGRCRVGGYVVGMLTTDKIGMLDNGNYRTKPDGYRHLVIAIAAHEVQDIHEMYIQGVPIGATDATGWATAGPSEAPWGKVKRAIIESPTALTFSAAGQWSFDPVLFANKTIVKVLAANTQPLSSNADGGPSGTAYSLTVAGPRTIGGAPANAQLYVSCEIEWVESCVRWTKHLGTDTQTVDTYLNGVAPADWTVNHRLQGHAYVTVTLDLEDPRFQGGVPGINFDVSGRKVLDPRTGTTVWTRNPALIIYDWLRQPWGYECAAQDVDTASVITAANACDVAISLTVGTTTETGQATYTCDGAFTTEASKESVLEDLAETMGGFANYGAKWSVHAGMWTAPVMTLTDDYLAGPLQIVQAGVGMDAAFNGVRGTYIQSGTDTPSDIEPYKNASYVTADGLELWTNVGLPYTNHKARARNLCRVMVERNRDGLVAQYPADLRAWPLEVGDRVSVTNTEYGWTAKTFRITDWQFDLTSAVVLTLQEDAATIYDLADASAADAAPNTTLPNPWAIEQVAGLVATSGTATLMLLADGTIVPRVLVTWTAPTSAHMSGTGARTEVEWTTIGSSTWMRGATLGGDNSLYLGGLRDDGSYLKIRARHINTAGIDGPWVTIVHQVIGKSAVPANVAGLAATVVQGGVRINWTASSEIDYASTQLRIGTSWASATPLADIKGNTYTWPWPAQGSYTLLARHLDTSGGLSAAAASTAVVVDASALVQWNNITGQPQQGRNLVDTSEWVAGLADAAVPWLRMQSTAGENSIILNVGPRGVGAMLWRAVASGDSATSVNADGGFAASYPTGKHIVPDVNKAYRVVVPVKRVGSTVSGTCYVGIAPQFPAVAHIANLNTTTFNNNPYFEGIGMSALPADVWCVVVGYVYPAGSTGMSHDGSGVYRCDTGSLVSAGTNFCFMAGATIFGVRAFQYGCTVAGTELHIGEPQIHIADGTEPSILALMGDGAWRGIAAVLSNDSHTVPADSAGVVSTFAGAASTITVLQAGADTTASWTITKADSGCTSTLAGTTVTVTALAADVGYVDITATRPGYATLTRRFTVAKAKAGAAGAAGAPGATGATGATGAAGAAATAYWIERSVGAIGKSVAGVYTPATVTFNARSATGAAAPAAYAGRFIVEQTTDGTTWTTVYTSAANEASRTQTPAAGIKALRVTLYLAGGTVTQLDQEVVPVVVDGATGATGSTGATGPTGISPISVILGNEAHVLPADASGNVISYAGSGTTVSVYQGSTLLLYDGVGTSAGTWRFSGSTSVNYTFGAVTTSSGVAVVADGSGVAVGIDTASATFGIVGKALDGTALSISRIQTFGKSKQGSAGAAGATGATGAAGAAGAAATAYWLARSAGAIRRSVSGAYTPASLTVTAYSATGTGAPAAYAGRFVIATSTDGSTYTAAYTSAANESSTAYTPPAGVVSLRLRLYLAGGTTTLLDEEVVPIVKDGMGVTLVDASSWVPGSATPWPTYEDVTGETSIVWAPGIKGASVPVMQCLADSINKICQPEAISSTATWFPCQTVTGVADTFAVDATTFYTGTSSFKLTKATLATNAQGRASRAIAVTPGQVYRVRVAVKGDTATATGVYVRIHQAAALPSSGAINETNRSGFTVIQDNGAVTTSFVVKSLTYTVPAGVNAISLGVFSWANGPLNLWFDEPVINLASGTDSAVGPRQNYEGGFAAGAANSFVPDTTKTYRFVIPIWRDSDAAFGYQYFGPEANKVCNLNTSTPNGNPYFEVQANTLTAGRWYLAVGYVYPAGSTGMTNNDAGVWDTLTGAKVFSGTNFCWLAGVTSCGIRALQHVADTGSKTLFGQPLVHVVDGNEPPLRTWLAVSTTDIAPGAATAIYETVTPSISVWNNGNSALVGTLNFTADADGIVSIRASGAFSVVYDAYSAGPGSNVACNFYLNGTKNLLPLSLPGVSIGGPGDGVHPAGLISSLYFLDSSVPASNGDIFSFYVVCYAPASTSTTNSVASGTIHAELIKR